MTAAALAVDASAVVLLAATAAAHIRHNAGAVILCGAAALVLAVGGVVAGVCAR